jgi:hypothetical protein
MNWFWVLGESAQESDRRKVRRRDKAMADKVWKDQCRWPLTTVQETDLQWIATSTFSEDRTIRFDHPSAHALLGRYAVVDHWVPRLEKQALNKMYADTHVVERWALLDHLPFWEELARVFYNEEHAPYSKETPFHAAWESPWLNVLEIAGNCGNLAPFRVCPREQLVRYLPLAVMPHPRVGLWLENQGVCTMGHLRTLLNAETLPMFGGVSNSFSGSPSGEPVAAIFAAEWCQAFLREYELPIDQKIRLVAQTIFAFGHEKWIAYIEEACKPYLQDVDFSLLYAVCGVNKVRNDQPEHALLQTVVCMSGNPIVKYDAQTAMDNMGNTRETMHAGLAMLCDFMPPKDRLDLYSLGLQALNIDKGVVYGVDILELPGLV